MLKKAHVLVVEDDPPLRAVVAEFLGQTGMEVVAVATADDAILEVEPGRLDLLVTDLCLPGESGFDLVRRVRLLDPALAVVVITGYGDLSTAVEAMRLEADDFLPKPFEADELVDSCQRAIERGRRRRAGEDGLARAGRFEQLKSRFLDGVSRELREPLTAILGLCEMLDDQVVGPLNDKQRRYVRFIGERGRQLLGVVADALEYSEIETGAATLSVADLDPDDVMAAAAAIVEAQAMARQVRIDLRPAGEIGLLRGDRARIIRALSALVANAVRLSPRGGAVLLSARGRPADLTFRVTDQGAGIPADALEAIFEEFENLRHGEARPSGAGLGLSLARRLARLHGGDIQIESVFGVGSTFSLQLPRDAAVGTDGPARPGAGTAEPAAELENATALPA